MDVDKLLNYEEECYSKGYDEGLNAGKTQGHTEGRELGIQTGFLRYLPMGVLQARVEAWQETETGDSINALVETVATPDLTNNPDTANGLDRRFRLAKNKCRLAASARNSPAVDAHEHKIVYQRTTDGTTNIEDMY